MKLGHAERERKGVYGLGGLWRIVWCMEIGAIGVVKVLELHCGIGFFSLFLAQRSNFLTAYEMTSSLVGSEMCIRDSLY